MPLPGAASFSAVAVASLALSACYVVPIDPRTGQPYPTTSRESVLGLSGHSAAPTPAVVAQPPTPTLINVRLYPLNAQANKGGMLSAQVVDNNAGHGSFRCPTSATRCRANRRGSMPAIRRSASSTSRCSAPPRARSPDGAASPMRTARTASTRSANTSSPAPGSGTGVCQFSDGAYYQMHFGG